MYDSQVPGFTVTVVKSPYYYGRYAVHVDKIVFQSVSSGSTGVAALQAGDMIIPEPRARLSGSAASRVLRWMTTV